MITKLLERSAGLYSLDSEKDGLVDVGISGEYEDMLKHIKCLVDVITREFSISKEEFFADLEIAKDIFELERENEIDCEGLS